MSLDSGEIEAIAARVAEILLEHHQAPLPRYLDARQLARVLGIERDWVYAHAGELGAVRLGAGRGRLRFDLQHTTRALGSPPQERPATRPARRRPRRNGDVDLLPYES